MRRLTPILIALAALLSGCSARQAADYAPVYGPSPIVAGTLPQYSFGFPAIRHARSLWERYAQLIAALNNSGTGFVLKMASGQTADRYDANLRAGAYDFAMVDPYQVLVAEQRGYAVIARTGKADRIRGAILVRDDSDIHRLSDLRNRSIAFTNPTSLAGTLLNDYGLYQSGLNVRKATSVVYTHSPETSLLRVALKSADAAAVSTTDWDLFRHDNPAPASQLRLLWQSDDLSGPAVMAFRAVPPDRVASLQGALLALASQSRGREALAKAGISEFRAGNSVSYDDVWDFLQRHQRALGPLPDRMVPK